jgi:hypothetical protein
VVLEKDGEVQLNGVMRNEEVVHKVKEERNVLHTVKIRKDSFIGYMLRRNCLLKHIIEGSIEVTER